MYIGIEELAANALIALLQRNPAERFVRFSTLRQYGLAVVKRYKKSTRDEAILIYSREANSLLFTNYSDFFVPCMDDEGYEGIAVKEGKTVRDLMAMFIVPLPVDVQMVMADSSLIEKYLQAA
jgi:hypothetical protein